MDFKRRDFLKAVSATAGVIGTSGLFLLKPRPARGALPRVEWRVNSVCGQCPGGCGIQVRVYQGKVKRIDGNPLCPVNRGGLCPNGQAGAAVLYDPDRLRHPVKKVGGHWEAVGWDEALQEIADRLKGTRQQGRPHAVVAIAGDLRGTLREVFVRFLSAYGSPHLLDAGAFPPVPIAPDAGLMSGVGQGQVIDLERTGFILDLSGGIFEAARNPVEIGMAWGRLRSQKGQRTRLVHASPRLGITAAKADEWVPLRPGAEGALALGIAHMIVRENLYDQDFVTHHCDGFFDWTDEAGKSRSGFRSTVLKSYSPRQVSEITGVDPDVTIRLARQFAAGKPSVAVGPEGQGPGSLPLFDRMAILSLNALVGSLDVPGGMLTGSNPPEPKLPPYVLDEVAQRCLRERALTTPDPSLYPLAQPGLAGLEEALLTGKPYDVQAVLLYQADPVFRSPGGRELAEALAKVPLVVSFDSFATETNRAAHFILPNHTYLERLEDVPGITLQGYPIVGLRQPVVAPLHDTRHTGEVLLQLAARVGAPVSEALPFASFEEALRSALRSTYETRKGDVIGKRTEEVWTRMLEKSGWRAASYKSFDEFWALLQERGGWWDPNYYHGEYPRVLKTPSGRFEFVPDALKRNRAYLNLRAQDGDRALMPHVNPMLEVDPGAYPLRLVVYALPNVTRGSSNVAWLQDTAGFALEESWETWVEVNPATAAQYRLVDRGFAQLSSARGAIRCRVRHHPGVLPGVVSVPFGLGRTTGGRWTQGIGSDVGPLLAIDKDAATGEPIWHSTRVSVERT